MPRSAAEGLIGAIIGLDSDTYSDKLEFSNIAIGIVGKVNKIPFSMMHTHVDAWKEFGNYLKNGRMRLKPEDFRARVKVEFLRDPKYRIYFNHDSDLQDSLKRNLQNHETVFTPYLGTSSMMANFSYVGEYAYSTIEPDEPVPISSVIPYFKKLPDIKLESGVSYAFEQNIPIHISADRILKGVFNAIYSPTGAKISVAGLETRVLKAEEGQENFVCLPTKVPP
jgi:CRISPR-associated protein Cas5h